MKEVEDAAIGNLRVSLRNDYDDVHDGADTGFTVPGYPTKVIIDPEGRLRGFTIGENEGFYGNFEAMINEWNRGLIFAF